MKNLLDDPLESLYVIEKDERVGCGVLTWLQYVTSEELVEISDRFLKFLKENSLKKIINDSRNSSHIMLEEDQRWLVENYIPRLLALGIKASAIVVPANKLIKLQVEDVVEEILAPGMPPTQYFGSVEEAKEWISRF